MNPIEHLIGMLAPHICLACKSEGSPLCLPCMSQELTKPKSACYRCAIDLKENYICEPCLQETGISQLFIGSRYAGFAKDLTKQLKFQRAKAAANAMGAWLDHTLPPMPSDIVICPVPTASRRVRARGYDQASLIAKDLAKRRKLPYRCLLQRITSTRQVGANRHDRILQMQQAFAVNKRFTVNDKRILLIDDILTTGSTIESAAKVLTAYKPKAIYAALFAYQATEGAFPSNTRTGSR